jgi:hypothetical protein
MINTVIDSTMKFYEGVTDRALESLAQGKNFQIKKELGNRSLAQVNSSYFESISKSDKAREMIAEYNKSMQDMTSNAARSYRKALNQVNATEDLVAKQQILDRFANAGIHGFTNSAGARWNIETYSRQQTAYLNNELMRMQVTENAKPDSLFLIAGGATECDVCSQYVGEVMTAAEVSSAEADGLFHPNCVHYLKEVESNAKD